ncbi:hypothetical protein SLE2022_375820 [Rubroshorea leprosula]
MNECDKLIRHRIAICKETRKAYAKKGPFNYFFWVFTMIQGPNSTQVDSVLLVRSLELSDYGDRHRTSGFRGQKQHLIMLVEIRSASHPWQQLKGLMKHCTLSTLLLTLHKLESMPEVHMLPGVEESLIFTTIYVLAMFIKLKHVIK